MTGDFIIVSVTNNQQCLKDIILLNSLKRTELDGFGGFQDRKSDIVYYFSFLTRSSKILIVEFYTLYFLFFISVDTTLSCFFLPNLTKIFRKLNLTSPTCSLSPLILFCCWRVISHILSVAHCPLLGSSIKLINI